MRGPATKSGRRVPTPIHLHSAAPYPMHAARPNPHRQQQQARGPGFCTTTCWRPLTDVAIRADETRDETTRALHCAALRCTGRSGLDWTDMNYYFSFPCRIFPLPHLLKPRASVPDPGLPLSRLACHLMQCAHLGLQLQVIVAGRFARHMPCSSSRNSLKQSTAHGSVAYGLSGQ